MFLRTGVRDIILGELFQGVRKLNEVLEEHGFRLVDEEARIPRGEERKSPAFVESGDLPDVGIHEGHQTVPAVFAARTECDSSHRSSSAGRKRTRRLPRRTCGMRPAWTRA